MINGAYKLGSNKIDLKKNYSTLNNIKFNKIFEKTGIRFIYRSTKKENSHTLAHDVGKKNLKNIKEDIESLIFLTQSPVSTIPSSGSLLHKDLRLGENCYVLDIIQGCSSFPYAFNLAINLIKNKEFNNSLIICSETYTKYILKNNKTCLPIFSDAASSLFINNETVPNLISSIYLTDGKGHKNLCINKKGELFMNGIEVFSFTSEKVPYAVNELLKKANLEIKDISYFIFHQASKIVLDTIQQKLQIPKEKFLNNIELLGNTVSSTIPIGLIESFKNKKILKGKPFLLMGFGVGYSLSGGIYKFD
jgi:3-oxoacyl-[acyl-carrier-protein] synthase III